ncbi:MAG: signal peptidase II, partial [Zetaproteobacteria bacterium]
SAAFTPRTVIPGVFDLVRAHNTGVAFSLLVGAPSWALAVLALAILAWIVHAMIVSSDRIERLLLAAITGGAIGNLIDRLRLGYVVDFLDVHIGPYHWPAFNVADAAITIGAIGLTWRAITARNRG